MSKKKGGDASLLIGLRPGVAIGAAVAITRLEVSRSGEAEAQQWLEPAKARIEGAAEAAE